MAEAPEWELRSRVAVAEFPPAQAFPTASARFFSSLGSVISRDSLLSFSFFLSATILCPVISLALVWRWPQAFRSVQLTLRIPSMEFFSFSVSEKASGISLFCGASSLVWRSDLRARLLNLRRAPGEWGLSCHHFARREGQDFQ